MFVCVAVCTPAWICHPHRPSRYAKHHHSSLRLSLQAWGDCDAWGRPFCPPPPPLSEVCARAPTPALASYLLQQQALAQAQAQAHSQAQRQWQKWHQGDHGAGAIGPPPTARPGKGASATTSWAAWEEGGGEEKGAESDVPPLLRGLALPVAAANGTYTLWG